MNAKQATFELLDEVKDGETFTGAQLEVEVRLRTGEIHYPATILRYMRRYREVFDRNIVCINKAKSRYRIEG